MRKSALTRALFLLIYVLMYINAIAQQNFVPNNSFEDYTICPSLTGQIGNISDWFSPSTGSPDYFNVCASGSNVGVPSNLYGQQIPNSGDGYAGITVFKEDNKREYLSNEMVATMEVGKTYCVDFKVSLADKATYGFYGIENIGIDFSTNSPSFSGDQVIPRLPEVEYSNGIIDEENLWTTITGSFVADQAYNYFTIGNFYSNNNTNGGGVDPGTTDTLDVYYYIDDVNIYEIPEDLVNTQSQTVCQEDQITLSAIFLSNANYIWYTANNPTDILSTSSTLSVPAESTATYIVEARIGDCIITDNVFVNVVPIPNINFIAENACTGATTQFIDVSSNVLPGASYEWDILNDGTIESTSAGGLSFNFPGEGFYNVALTIYNSDDCFTKRIINIQITSDCDPCEDPFNFVPNGNMESFDDCPEDEDLVLGLSGITNWYQTTDGTSDYYNSCFIGNDPDNNLDVPTNTFGTQDALSEKGYLGFFAYREIDTRREYVSVKLEEPLDPDKSYCVSLNVSLGDNSEYGIAEIGAYFSDDDISSSTTGPLFFNPQVQNTTGILLDKQEWVSINGIYEPSSAVEYLTIGNFNNDANTTFQVASGGGSFPSAYYYLDDVLVTEIPRLVLNDTVGCVGNPFVINAPDGFCSYEWYLIGGPILSNTQTLSWEPPVEGTYQLGLSVSKESCTQLKTFEVVMSPQPNAEFEAQPGCFNEVITFINLSDGTVPGTTYEWDFDNDGEIDKTTDGSTGHVFNSPGTKTVTLIVTNPSGCFDEFQQSVFVDAVCDPCNPSSYVLNSGFEFLSDCPINLGQIENASTWFSPTPVSADYFNVCAQNGDTDVPNNIYGNGIEADEGNAYAGIVAYVNGSNNKTLIETKLAAPLVVGQQYCVGFKVRLAPTSGFAIDNIGAYFSEDEFQVGGSQVTPQVGNAPFNILDQSGWREISGFFTADVPYEYLSLGNFYQIGNTNLNADRIGVGDTAYYYIDDVSIAPVELEIDGPDEVCAGDAIAITASTNLCEHAWVIEGSNNVIGTESILSTIADSTTTYVYIGSNSACDSIKLSWTVEVNQSPNLGDDVSICQGASVQLNDVSGGAISYTWSPATGLSNASIRNPFAMPLVTTTYTLNVQYPGPTDCSTTDVITVFVEDINVEVSQDQTLCKGEGVSLFAIGGDIYTWVPATGLSNSNVNNPTASPLVTTTYLVTGTDTITNCTDTASITIFINNCDTGGPNWQDDTGNDVTDICDTTSIDGRISIPMPNLFDPDVAAGSLDFVLITNVIGPNTGQFTVSLDSAIFVPDPGFTGTQDVYIVACDTAAPIECDTLHLCLSVFGEGNSAPTFGTDELCLAAFTNEVLVECLNITDNQTSAADMNYTVITSQPFNGDGIFVDGDGCLNYDPSAYTGNEDSATIIGCDTEGLCDTMTVNYLVFQANLPPTASNQTFSVFQGQSFPFCLSITDANIASFWGEVLSTNLESSPANGSLAFTNDSCMVYTPEASFIGQDQITFTVCDDGLDFVNYNGICSNVNGVNNGVNACTEVNVLFNVSDGLILQNDSDTFEDGFGCTYNLLENDMPQVVDSVYIQSGPFFGNASIINAQSGIVEYTPTVGYVGTDSLVYVACIDGLGCETAVFNINVVNQLEAVDDERTIQKNTIIDIVVLFNDVYLGNQDLELTFIDSTDHGTIVWDTLNSFSVDYIPDPDFVGIDMFEYQIEYPSIGCNNAGIVSTAVVTIFVEGEDVVDPDGPVAADDNASANFDETILIMIIENDIDNAMGGLTIDSVSNPANGTAEIVDGQIQYNPNSTFVGTDTITYVVCDINGLCSSATIYINVRDPYVAPRCSLENIMGGISPNNDNKNDLFIIDALLFTEQDCSWDLTNNQITIFNRWGNIVYQKREYGADGDWWNGTWQNNGEELPVGTYFYVIEIDGYSKKDYPRGSVELFR